MRKILFILALVTYFAVGCSEDSTDPIILYDVKVTAYSKIEDIRTSTGKILHTRNTSSVVYDRHNVSAQEKTRVQDRYKGVDISTVDKGGDLSVRTSTNYKVEIKQN